MSGDWLNSNSFASLLQITPRAARKALCRALAGKSYKSMELQVREVPGRGGRQGKVLQVRVDTLPIDIQERLKAHLNAPSMPLTPRTCATHFDAVLEWVSRFVDEVEATKPGTVARANVLRAWSEKKLPDIKGSNAFCTYSERTLRRFLKDYERYGAAALQRATRNDHKTKRTIVTVTFDAWAREVGLENELEPIAEALKTRIRGWHKASESVSAIRLDAARRLEKLVRERGFEPPNGVCNIPLYIVKAESKYRAVAKFKKDRKAFEDKSPAIRRTIEGLWPMDIVVGDVHPLDFFLPETEDYQRYAKAICWLDVATKRLWATVVFLPKGTGIRNSHVIASFMEMVAEWGLPRTLYLDNGQEYRFAEFIKDAIALNDRGMKVLAGGEQEPVRRARAYGARAKAIEGVFALLRHLFAKVPGYVGGDRMKSKVANVGKPPEHFPSIELFPQVIAGILAQYHANPQGKKSQLGDISPIDAFNRAVNAGWQKTEVDPDSFAMVFSEKRAVAIKNGAITVNGRIFYFDRLVTYHGGDYVTVRVPKYEQWARLPVEDMQGNFLGFAEEDRPFNYFDSAGGRESDRRRKLQRRAVRQLDNSVPDIDVTAEILDFQTNVPKALPAPVGARVTASDKEKAVARSVKESPEAKRKRADNVRRYNIEKSNQAMKELIEKIDERKAKQG
jgi:hypothetical protein